MKRIGLITLSLFVGLMARASEEKLNEMTGSLRIGMSFEEVRRLDPKIGNCRGSAKSFMVCQGSFSRDGDKYYSSAAAVAAMAISGNLSGIQPSRTYETLILHFKENKLERWDLESSRH